MGPINYSLNVQNPMQAFMESAQLGSGMAANQAQKAAAEQTAATQKNKMLIDQWESRSKEQQSQDLQTGGQIIAAINSGSPEAAQQILAARAAAARNAGDEARAKGYETNAELIKINPPAAAATYQTMMATLPGGDKIIESLGKIGEEGRKAALAPAQLTEAQAKAQSAAVAANFAESGAVLDLQKKQWDISKIQNDMQVQRQNTEIAALNAGIKKETNDLKRQQMQVKLDEAKLKREETVRTRVSDVEAGRTTMDNMLNTVDKALKAADKKLLIGTVGSRAAGLLDNLAPTFDQDVGNYEELLNTIRAQAFLTQTPSMKGLGALTETEGKKLEASLQNLSLRQGEGQLKDNLQEAQRLILKFRSNLATKYGVPDNIPDTPAAAGSPDINSLVDKYAPVVNK